MNAFERFHFSKSKIREWITNSTLVKSINLLPAGDKRKMSIVVIIQMGLGVLDLFAIALVGVLGALTVSGIQSKNPSGRVGSIIDYFGLGNFSFQTQVAVIGGIAAIALISRTLLSVYFARLTMFFLSRRSAIISANLVAKFLSQPLLFVKERNSQETLYSVTFGVASITLGVVSTFVTMISDGLLLIIMAFGLLFVDSLTALLTFFLLGIVAFVLHTYMQKRARRIGETNSKLTIEGNALIFQVLESYREATVRNRRSFYVEKISESRMNLANLSAEMTFMPNISKYTIEITMVISALVISAFQFILNDASSAIATLSVFLTASARMGPAILRIQQGLIQMKISSGSAKPTLELIERLSFISSPNSSISPLQTLHRGFEGSITLTQVSLRYPERKTEALSEISLEIKQGQFVAIVGPSGAGKTSLVDVILGIVIPSHGDVFISNRSAAEAISKWPGAIAYVPQDVFISEGTIEQNVALGYEGNEVSKELVWDALRRAQLEDHVKNLPKQVEEEVGERGSKLSGGQRQRLGIARALYTKPKVIVFDEATSALDAETEAKLASTINSLRGEVTVIMVAHRLSTVRSADLVVYLEDGRVVASGTFEEVRSKVPKFENQAKLMGL